MLTVRLSGSGNPNADAAPYPSANPQVCNVATAAMSAPPALAIAAEDDPMMLEQMSATVITATSGQIGRTFFTASGNHFLSARPPRMGSSTTWRVLANNPPAGTGTKVPANVFVITGVKAHARKVEAVVSTTESATLALPR